MYTVEKHEHIGILSGLYLNSVKKMLLQHYNNGSHNKYFFIVNHWVPNDVVNEIRKNGYEKIIYYNLEHVYLRDFGVSQMTYNYWREDNKAVWKLFDYVDEIWDFMIENKPFFERYREKYKFVPMRYYNDSLLETNKNPKYDILFYGVLDTDARKNIMHVLTTPTQFGWDAQENQRPKILYQHGHTIDEISNLAAEAKYVFDYPHYSAEYNGQNVVRIFEAICKNKNVITCLNTKIRTNYFDGIAKTLNVCDNMFLNYYDFVMACVEEPIPNVSEKYRVLTEKDSDYEAYKTGIIEDYEKRQRLHMDLK